MSSAAYLPLLRIPGAAGFFLFAAVGRVGISMTGLSLIWLVHARTGSYGTAGLATAGFTLAEALIGPQLARLIDRFGQAPVLRIALPAHGAAVLILLTADSPTTQIVAATCAGAVVPQLGALSAARWSHLLRRSRPSPPRTVRPVGPGSLAEPAPGARPVEARSAEQGLPAGSFESRSPVGKSGAAADPAEPGPGAVPGASPSAVAAAETRPAVTSADSLATAFSLESLANATAFLLGPAVATTLGASGHAVVASGLAAALILIGGTALTLQRKTAPPPARTRPRRPLLRLGFMILALSNLAVGVYFGTIAVAVSAFATGHGIPEAATAILLAASASGLISGWLYGLRRHRAPAHRQFVVVAGYLVITAPLVLFAQSPGWLAGAVILTEAAVPPTLVLLNVMTENAVHPGVLTQALTWNNSFSAAGSALAASAAGHLADEVGAAAAFGPAPVAAVMLLLLAVIARRTQRISGPHSCPEDSRGPAESGLT